MRHYLLVGDFSKWLQNVPTHVALRMFIMQVLASQLHFLANKNAELATPPLFWPVNCIEIGGHVALLSDPTVYSLSCACTKILISKLRLFESYHHRLARAWHVL